MDRRNFIGLLIGGVSATAAVRSWPFRVFSFPSTIVTGSGIQAVNLEALDRLAKIYYSKEALENLKNHLRFEAISAHVDSFSSRMEFYQYGH